MPVATKASKKELIKAATISCVTSKEGKTLGFLVKSDSSNEYYQVRSINVAGEHVFTCTCHAGQAGFTSCTKNRYCKHVRAVIEWNEARKQLAAEQAEVEAAIEAAQAIVTMPTLCTKEEVEHHSCSCSCCGRPTKRAGLCGRCLDF